MSAFLLIQGALGGYREGFVRELKCRAPGTVVVAAGPVHFEPSLTTDVSDDLVDVALRNVFLLNRRLLWQRGVLRLARSSDSIVAELNPRILSTWMVALYSRVRGRRCSLWGHFSGRELDAAGPRLGRRLQVRLAGRVLAYTPVERERFAMRFPRIDVFCAPNALFSEQLAPTICSTRRRTDFVYVGRHTAAKRCDLLVRAFARVVGDRPDFAECRLVLAGAGPETESLRELAKGYGIAHRVLFPGPRFSNEDLQELYAGAIAALSGGYVGLNLTQALWFGVPMIYPDAEPHAPEIVLADAANSWCFRSGDVESLGLAMAAAWAAERCSQIDHEVLAERVVRTYNVESMATGMIDAFSSAG